MAKIDALAEKIEEAKRLRQLANTEASYAMRTASGMLPAHFVTSGRIGDILLCKPRNGWSPSCDNLEGGVGVLSLRAVTGFRYNGVAHKRTSLPTSKDAHYWLNDGDLLITRSNTPELVGHAAIYDGMPTPCIYPDLMMRLTVNPTKADIQFVWRWLQTSIVRDYIAHNAKGTSPTMKKISQETVMAIPFPTETTITEQRRIVAYLDELQEKVDSLKAAQAASAAELDALLPSILDKAFKGEL